ncbi:hypothetical protein FWP36_24295, partial [Vibrio parahaemolyticus]|nr:hypothetical protein [Vibrio parahaemolyticus]
KRQSAITRRLRRIHNAWHFRFALNLVFTAQWFRFGGRVAHHLTRRYNSKETIWIHIHCQQHSLRLLAYYVISSQRENPLLTMNTKNL